MRFGVASVPVARQSWLVLALVLLVACSESAASKVTEEGASVPPAETPLISGPSGSTSVPQSQPPLIPIDGNPQEIGVASIDFVTAMFPTSPEEHRVTSAWMALRYNVQQSWESECMAEQGLVLVPDRLTAAFYRRNADMPDFELDAERGIWEPGDPQPGDPGPGPPASASAAEAEAWHMWYLECSNQIEWKLSKEFDEVIGRAPFWWGIVREVNNSKEMAEATDTLLDCVSDGGGPQVDRILDIYLYLDTVVAGSDSKEEAQDSVNSVGVLIAECAGDYNRIRQELLIPKRDEIVAGYADVLAEAEKYFNEVMSVGFTD